MFKTIPFLYPVQKFCKWSIASFLFFAVQDNLVSQTVLPRPDHIVILILENHAYGQIIGSSAAPYINALASDSASALFTNSYALEHPSQPNYLELYSGSNQNVINNSIPAGIPFTTENLGRQLMDAGKRFTTYSEGLPFVGYNGAVSYGYVRKHNPAANWMGSGINQIPANTNQPFSAFPFDDFSKLPTVCFVIPTQNNSMHNGSDPYRITNSDHWVEYNLDKYIQWAKTHNSVFMLTFDEDNGTDYNHIVTIFNGQMVKGGQYADTINHYTILRTIEDMYGLPYAAKAATADPITDCWNFLSGISAPPEENIGFAIYPNPAQNVCTLDIENRDVHTYYEFEIYSIFGKRILSGDSGDNIPKEIDLTNIPDGIYLIKISDGHRTAIQKLIIE